MSLSTFRTDKERETFLGGGLDVLRGITVHTSPALADLLFGFCLLAFLAIVLG
jgi:hypothetical protein